MTAVHVFSAVTACCFPGLAIHVRAEGASHYNTNKYVWTAINQPTVRSLPFVRVMQALELRDHTTYVSAFKVILALTFSHSDARTERHPPSDATSSALYLRTLLRALDWAASNSYDVRELLRNMLKTKTVGQLYNVFFDR